MPQSHCSESENSATTGNPPAMQLSEAHPGSMDAAYDDEIDLFQLFEALWRQKVLIAGITLLCLAGASAYLLLATPLYEVSAQVRPGVTAFEEGKPVYGWPVADIQSWVKDEHYRPYLVESWGGDKGLPAVTARSGRNGKFVTLSLKAADPEHGKKALQGVLHGWIQYYTDNGADAQIQFTARNFEKQISDLKDRLRSIREIETGKLENQVAERRREVKKIEQQIRQAGAQKGVVENSLQVLNLRMEKSLENTDQLSRLRDALIQKGQAESLSFLLYTNIIQQNIYHVSDLQNRVADLQKMVLYYKQQIDNLAKQSEDVKDTILQLKQQKEVTLAQAQEDVQRRIAQIQEQQKSLAPIEVIAPPIASSRPVSPKRLLTVILALFVGAMLGVMAAWVRAGWQSRKERVVSQI